MDLATKKQRTLYRRPPRRTSSGDHERAGFHPYRSAAPDWLEKAWTGTKQRGLDKLTPADIADISTPRSPFTGARTILPRAEPRGPNSPG
jgi:hypothetical protein